MKVDTLSWSRPKLNLTLKALRNNGTFTEGLTGSGGDGHTNLAEQIVLIIACEHLALSLHSSCYSFKATSNPSKPVANNSKLRNQSSRAVRSLPPQHLPPLSLKGAGFLCTANLIRLKKRWNKMLWRFSSTPCLGSDLAWPRSSCLPLLLAPYNHKYWVKEMNSRNKPSSPCLDLDVLLVFSQNSSSICLFFWMPLCCPIIWDVFSYPQLS